MANLYVFLDESGNYDSSPTGTKYPVYTSPITTDVTRGVLELYQLRHSIIDQGIDVEYFHYTTLVNILVTSATLVSRLRNTLTNCHCEEAAANEAIRRRGGPRRQIATALLRRASQRHCRELRGHHTR